MTPPEQTDRIHLPPGGNPNDLLLQVERVLAYDRLAACELLGLSPELLFTAAASTFEAALTLHIGRAPNGNKGAGLAAAGDVFLAGLIIGRELR